MAELDKRIKILLFQNVSFFTQLIKTLEKHQQETGQSNKFIIDVCLVAIRENRKVLDTLNQLEFEPEDEETNDYVQQLHLNQPEPEKEKELTEDEKRDIQELEKIYSTPDPDLQGWFKRLISKGKKQ